MADTKGSTKRKAAPRKTRFERALEIVNAHEFGTITAGELHNRLEDGNEHTDVDINSMLRDVRDILNGKQGREALAGFRQRLFEIARRNIKKADAEKGVAHAA
jgi:hypothetical protein